jgi:hypothetical protein
MKNTKTIAVIMAVLCILAYTQSHRLTSGWELIVTFGVPISCVLIWIGLTMKYK